MKVLQTIQGMAASSGGPSTCTRDLLEGLSHLNAEVDLLTASCMNPKESNLGAESVWLKEVPYDYKTPLCFSKNIRKYLINSQYDIYHVNALWMYTNHITCKVARDKHKPYIISPHGMLYPTALAIKYWKKWPMLKIWFNKDIHNATCLHATCYPEMMFCRDFGYKGPIAVIPNPVVFPQGLKLSKSKPEKICIGFLGRLHPIKKIENLLYGAAIAIKSGCIPFSIEIMGKGDSGYEQFLRDEVDRLGLSEYVHFVGFVSGNEKYERLSKLWALFVPSAQENFGMIVPESLICGTPVYASTGTPWSELNDSNCGWWKDNSPETISSVILDLLSKSEDEILRMGVRGRNLIEEKYEQHKVAEMMLKLYKWINGESEKPEFVYE